MYFKAIPVTDKYPDFAKWVTTIDKAGNQRVQRFLGEREVGIPIWETREKDGRESPSSDIPITHWLEKADIGTMARKAKKWDDLDAKISKFYPEDEYDEDGELIEAEPVGDLCDIGEIAASALGYL